MEPVVVREVQPGDAEALARLFANAGVACHCRYWHFQGSTNDWLDRCANHVEDNRSELVHGVEEGTAEMRGAVALSERRIVGWVKLTAARDVQKIYGQRLYRGLPCFDGDREATFTVGCFLVDPAWRRRGVARRLLSCAIDLAARAGGRAVEAFPRRAEGVSDAELFTGPYACFAEAGFEVVHDFGPYPVLRRRLAT